MSLLKREELEMQLQNSIHSDKTEIVKMEWHCIGMQYLVLLIYSWIWEFLENWHHSWSVVKKSTQFSVSVDKIWLIINKRRLKMVHQLKLRFGLFILLGYYLPILLIWVGIIPFEFRFHTLVAMAIIMIDYCFLKKISF